jgi:predicted negative regulator of RcsB-dependent stress response
MKHGESWRDWLVRHRMHLNVAALLACGVWAGWLAWMTQPDDMGITAPASPICCFRAVK